jgi:hypothetical protein
MSPDLKRFIKGGESVNEGWQLELEASTPLIPEPATEHDLSQLYRPLYLSKIHLSDVLMYPSCTARFPTGFSTKIP